MFFLYVCCFNIGITVELSHLKEVEEATVTITIWPDYYTLAQCFNESSQTDSDFLLIPHNRHTLRHINMQAHGKTHS